MQIMASLLNLQARGLKDPAQAELLKESQSRIKSMSIVHEKLYRSGDLSRIDFSDYIESLAVHLFQFLAVDPRRIRLRRKTESIPLDINNAIPCGLIINELVSNAVRHGFADGREGEVTVEFRRLEDGRLFLAVRDDGAGFPGRPRFPDRGIDGAAAGEPPGRPAGRDDRARSGRGTEFRIVFRELVYKPRV